MSIFFKKMKKLFFENKFTNVIEFCLYIFSGLVIGIFSKNIFIYIAFLFTVINSICRYAKTKNIFYIYKMLVFSIILPNNYITLFLLPLLSIYFFWKYKDEKFDYKYVLLIVLYLVINILINEFRLINLLFGLLYLSSVFFAFYFMKRHGKISPNMLNCLVKLVKKIIIIEAVTIFSYFLFHFNYIGATIDNDWLVGTFGLCQGNIFLYFMLFSVLLLKYHYSISKNKYNYIYMALALILSIMTNSIALLIAFAFSYFIITFLNSNKKNKIRTIFILFVACGIFLLVTPDWIKSYIVKLTDPKYFVNNIVKVKTYQKTFVELPKNDAMFLVFGNGIGQYSSRAALTCTGKYVDFYNKLFSSSISEYTEEYILKNYIKYNLELKHGTMYSPFSTILTIQGEYGMIGMIIFIAFILTLLVKSSINSKIFVLFFLLSCFIENYLEFAKIVSLLFILYFFTTKSKVEKKNSDSKKNLMFIIPTLCGGGAEKTVANLSKYLVNYYNVEIVVFKDTDVKYSYSGNLTILSKNKKRNLFSKMFLVFKYIYKLRKLKKEKDIDYAISFLTQADAINVFSKVSGVKTIISIRNTDSILMKNKLMRFITWVSCRRADHIVSISNQVKDDLIDNFKIDISKVTTIYNPSLSIEFGDSALCFKNDFFDDFVAINVGRLVEQKGQWHLIRAFSRVIKKYKNAKLIILGEGPLKDYLQTLINDYNLNNNVFLLGFVDNPYDYIKKSDCFVFSSLYEGLGNALLESLACGTPIISCDCISGPREILSPFTNYKNKVKTHVEYAEYGILVPVFDGEMKDATAPLSKEEILMSEAIISTIESNVLSIYKKKTLERSSYFNIKNITEQWVQMLNDIDDK